MSRARRVGLDEVAHLIEVARTRSRGQGSVPISCGQSRVWTIQRFATRSGRGAKWSRRTNGQPVRGSSRSVQEDLVARSWLMPGSRGPRVRRRSPDGDAPCRPGSPGGFTSTPRARQRDRPRPRPEPTHHPGRLRRQRAIGRSRPAAAATRRPRRRNGGAGGLPPRGLRIGRPGLARPGQGGGQRRLLGLSAPVGRPARSTAGGRRISRRSIPACARDAIRDAERAVHQIHPWIEAGASGIGRMSVSPWYRATSARRTSDYGRREPHPEAQGTQSSRDASVPAPWAAPASFCAPMHLRMDSKHLDFDCRK